MFNKQRVNVNQISHDIMWEYGYDPEGFDDRILELVNGNRPLADAVRRECQFILNPRPIRRHKEQRRAA